MERFEMLDRDSQLESLDAALKNDRVERSPLVRVLAIGKSLGDERESFELTALEVRAAGAVLYWRAITPADQSFALPQFVVTDDLGTRYEVFVARWVSLDGLSRGEAAVVPRPTESAATVR